LEKLGVTLQIEDAAQRHQKASFRNGNRPSLAVSIPQEQKKETLERVEMAISAMHKGPDNSAKTIMLSGGATATPLSMTPVEASLIEQRKLSREEVGMVYDLPGPLMNDLDARHVLQRRGTQPGVVSGHRPAVALADQETFQAQLLDNEPGWVDRFVEFDLTDKLKGDPDTLATSLKTQVEAGLITRNEARRILNMPPVDDPKPTNSA
jgi:phage portal protein BeeE